MPKMKMKYNGWLESSEFLSKADFHDRYYLESLCRTIANYIKNIPVQVLTTWNPIYKSIYFTIGLEKENKKYFSVDVNIAYWDFITLVKRWIQNYFPRYVVEYDIDIEYTENEIIEMQKKAARLNEPFDLDAALTAKKKKKIIEEGVITKIKLLDDAFTLTVNGVDQVRISGKPDRLIPLSEFLKTLKEISDHQARRIYIFENSKQIVEIKRKKDIYINYRGMQMLNFFKINFDDLKDAPFEKITERQYRWSRFRIKFESSIIEKDCLDYLETRGVNPVNELKEYDSQEHFINKGSL